MKNRLVVFAIIFVVMIAFLGGCYLMVNKVDMGFAQEAEVCFINGTTSAESRLSDIELAAIKAIFNRKKLFKDNPSCGFSEEVSIKFNQAQTFCIARDTCPIIYWKEKDMYFKLSEEEKAELYKILESYDFYFPCV